MTPSTPIALLILLGDLLVELGQVLADNVSQPQRNLVVVLHSDLARDGAAFVLIEQSRADRQDGILVTQLGVKPFPDADAEIGAKAEVVLPIRVGVLDEQHAGAIVKRRIIEVFQAADIAQVLARIAFFPAQLAIADVGVGLNARLLFGEADQSAVCEAETDGIAVLVGEINHHWNLHIIEFQVVTARLKARIRDGVALVGTFGIVEDLHAHVEPIVGREQHAGAHLSLETPVAVAIVAIDLRHAQAAKHFAFEQLGIQWIKTGGKQKRADQKEVT